LTFFFWLIFFLISSFDIIIFFKKINYMVSLISFLSGYLDLMTLDADLVG
jgi:hypothetical protein